MGGGLRGKLMRPLLSTLQYSSFHSPVAERIVPYAKTRFKLKAFFSFYVTDSVLLRVNAYKYAL